MRRPLLPALTLVLFAGCGSGPVNALLREIGGTLEGATRSEEPFPTPTHTGMEGTIETPTVQNTGPSSFTISFGYTSPVPVREAHIEIGGNHYVQTILEDEDSWSGHPSVCEYYAKINGGGCTEACIQACGCVQCSGDSTFGELVEGGCAATCSGWVQSGLVGPGKHFPSETVAAYAALSGDEYLPMGLLDYYPQAQCNANRCKAAADAAKKRVTFTVSNVVDWGFIGNLDVGYCTTVADPVNDTPVTSPPASGASVSPYSACDPGPCPRK